MAANTTSHLFLALGSISLLKCSCLKPGRNISPQVMKPYLESHVFCASPCRILPCQAQWQSMHWELLSGSCKTSAQHRGCRECVPALRKFQVCQPLRMCQSLRGRQGLIPTPLVLSLGWFYPPQPSGCTEWCLETLLIVTMGRGGAACIQWVEARDAAEHPTVHRVVPTTVVRHKMWIVPRLRNPALSWWKWHMSAANKPERNNYTKQQDDRHYGFWHSEIIWIPQLIAMLWCRLSLNCSITSFRICYWLWIRRNVLD